MLSDFLAPLPTAAAAVAAIAAAWVPAELGTPMAAGILFPLRAAASVTVAPPPVAAAAAPLTAAVNPSAAAEIDPVAALAAMLTGAGIDGAAATIAAALAA